MCSFVDVEFGADMRLVAVVVVAYFAYSSYYEYWRSDLDLLKFFWSDN